MFFFVPELCCKERPPPQNLNLYPDSVGMWFCLCWNECLNWVVFMICLIFVIFKNFYLCIRFLMAHALCQKLPRDFPFPYLKKILKWAMESLAFVNIVQVAMHKNQIVFISLLETIQKFHEVLPIYFQCISIFISYFNNGSIKTS